MSSFERLIDSLDPSKGGPLLALTSQERHEVARFVEKLRQWGRYNTIMRDIRTYGINGRYV